MTVKIDRFTAAELQPSTGEPHARFDLGKRDALGVRAATFNSTFVANPQHRAPLDGLDQLLAMGAGLRGTRQYALRITAPSGAGKSTVCDQFADVILRRDGVSGSDARPVVRVELEQACTVKRLWTAILAAYGDDFAARGDEEQLRRRAFRKIEEAGTRLLIIDETQHLFYRSKDGSFPTDAIKRALDTGLVPIALVGNESARTLLESNVQLVNRTISPCDIRPYDPDSDDDRSAFAGWVNRYDAAIVKAGLFRQLSGLDDQRSLAALMQASQGFVGRAANVIRIAGAHAFGRDAEFIEPFDLAHACSEWAVGQKLIPSNPFRAQEAA